MGFATTTHNSLQSLNGAVSKHEPDPNKFGSSTSGMPCRIVGRQAANQEPEEIAPPTYRPPVRFAEHRDELIYVNLVNWTSHNLSNLAKPGLVEGFDLAASSECAGTSSPSALEFTATGNNFYVSNANSKVLAMAASSLRDLPLAATRKLSWLITSIKINSILHNKYDLPPFDLNRPSLIYKTRASDRFVRLTNNPNNPGGGFITRERYLRDNNGVLLSAQKLKELFALEIIPTHVVDVSIPAGTRLLAGYAAGISQWGSGGGRQYFIDHKFPKQSEFDAMFQVREKLQR
jgi:hypothetical protein